MANMRPNRINTLGNINNASKYLEIGVCKGLTFSEIEIPNKDAVDPYFAFDYVSQASESVRFFEVPSDTFFQQYSNEARQYDVIYLDGLHEFNQTFRDFCATLSMSHKGTIWLIDDTVPSSNYAALPSQADARKYRDMVGDKQNAWMGDVYKVIFAIHDFFPQLSLRTFKSHGQTVVWQEPRTEFSPIFNSLEEIGSMQFVDFLEHKKAAFGFATDDEIFADVARTFSSEVVDSAA